MDDLYMVQVEDYNSAGEKTHKTHLLDYETHEEAEAAVKGIKAADSAQVERWERGILIEKMMGAALRKRVIKVFTRLCSGLWVEIDGDGNCLGAPGDLDVEDF